MKKRTIERFIWPTWLVVALLCLQPAVLASGSINQEPNEVKELEPGRMVEREISGGQSHTYQISLAAGQFMRVVVKQRGIDVKLALTAPDGKQLIEADFTGIGGMESLSAEAAASGDYRLTVRASGSTGLVGSYQVRLEVKAAPTAQDKQRVSAERLLDEARTSYQKGAAAVETTVEKGRQALTLWRQLGDRYWEGVTFNLIGKAYYSAGKYEQAIEAYNQSLGIRREVKDRAGEGATLMNLALCYWGPGRYEKAIEYLEQALLIDRELKNRPYEGTALYNLALVYINLNRYEKAIEYYEQALAIFHELKDRRSEADMLFRSGDANYKLSRSEKAITSYEQALIIYREVKSRADEGNGLNGLGNAYMRLSQSEKAIEYYEQALAIFREVKNQVDEGNVLTNLGGAYANLSRYEKSIDYHEQALAIHRDVKNRLGEGGSLTNLGIAYTHLGQTEKAIASYEQALIIYREIKDRLDEGYALTNLGITYTHLGQNEKAIASYEQARAIFRELKNRMGEGITLNNLGDAYEKLGQYEKAMPYYERCLAISREVKNGRGEFIALSNLAHAESQRGNLAQARTRFEESLVVAEWLRTEAGSPESRASLLAFLQKNYQRYTDVLMRQHQTEPAQGLDALALEVSERQRARSLLDLLNEAHADLRQGVDVALLERERIVGRQLNDKAQRLLQANSPEQAATLKQEVNQLETDYERAQADIRKASPHYAALAQPRPLKLKEIQAQLDADTLLLEYSLGEDHSYLWAITTDSLASYELPKGELIEKNARQVYELLTARSMNKRGETTAQRQERISQAEAQLPAAARGLSQTILAPVAAQLGNKRLVVVADGALQYIPFAMLPEPRSLDLGFGSSSNPIGQVAADTQDQEPKAKDQPLIVKHEVVSLPSASTLAIQRAELAGRKPAPKMLAVIADPVFDRTDPRLKTAPGSSGTEASDQPQKQTQTTTADDARSIEHLAENSGDKSDVKTVRLMIPRLPFTRQEANQLMALAPKGSSFSAIDFQATRATALDPALSQYRYIHIATHGLLDTERPGLSALVFSMVDAEGKPQNGFLRANDIYNLKLPAELVVLSACQTGLGKDLKGEGLVGLTRGFMYAGAARVVVSLWNVNDKATADLMTKFYEKMLKEGERPSAALRAAQVEMWKQKQWQSPYYWAAFTMQGEWR